MKIGDILETKEDFLPLYRKGDLFIIKKLNEDKHLMPIVARKIKDGEIYGFEEGELE